jgi:hypothetical protein
MGWEDVEEKGVWGIGEAPRLGKLLLDLGSEVINDTFMQCSCLMLH